MEEAWDWGQFPKNDAEMGDYKLAVDWPVKLYIGKLPRSLTSRELHDFLEKQHGEILEVVMKYTQSRKYMYAFVWTLPKVADSILSCGVQMCNGKTIPAAHDAKINMRAAKHTLPLSSCLRDKIFVGGLPYTATALDMQIFFMQYGTVRSAFPVFNRHGYHRGFGFVIFHKSDTVDVILKGENVKNVRFAGTMVEVRRAFPEARAVQTQTISVPPVHVRKDVMYDPPLVWYPFFKLDIACSTYFGFF